MIENEELISKKELLSLTQISYGQLYRWKRQNLIPESWFIKQSSFTGQETFFPKKKMLHRINLILELKDQYSLEELAEIFSPESTSRIFTIDELISLKRFDISVIRMLQEMLKQNQFSFRELLFIEILSRVRISAGFTDVELKEMILSIQQWLPHLKKESYRLVMGKRGETRFSLLIQQNALVLFDHETIEEQSFDLEELAKDLNFELNSIIREG